MITINKPVKIGLVIASSLLVIAVIGTLSLLLLKATLPTKTSQTSLSSEAEAQAIVDEGIKAESTGDTQKALTEYKAALVEYKKINNINKIADMEAKIKFAEKTLVQEKVLDKQSVPVDAAPPAPEPEHELENN